MVLGTRVERSEVVTGPYTIQSPGRGWRRRYKKGASYPGHGKLASNVLATH